MGRGVVLPLTRRSDRVLILYQYSSYPHNILPCFTTIYYNNSVLANCMIYAFCVHRFIEFIFAHDFVEKIVLENKPALVLENQGQVNERSLKTK